MSATEVTGVLWCDDFDADLPKLVPDAIDYLGDMAGVKLRTRSKPTNGRINCPSSWWTDHGLTAFFTTDRWGNPEPPGYVTFDPVVYCTFWEAVRDEWCHDAVMVVNGQFVWKSPGDLMMQLMFDVRGWGEPLDEARRGAIQDHVRASLSAATERLRFAIAGREQL